jgi:hypothetical protein
MTIFASAWLIRMLRAIRAFAFFRLAGAFVVHMVTSTDGNIH